MTDMTDMVGNEEGIKLWGLMYNSKDDEEIKYFKKLNDVCAEHGSVWFTDMIAERDSGKSQLMFFMQWSSSKKLWNITLFNAPQNVYKKILPRLDSMHELEK